ncbi:MAG TPA: hypothetical protein DCS48_11130 [Desulfovibrio sp.]|nr:hypothetical protein [Desulfovibrio sp.]
MQLFQSFSKFLLEVSGVKREQLECFAADCQTILSGKDLGNCMELCQIQYNGEFEITHYKGDANLLLAHIVSWLEDNDPYRFQADLPDPKLEVSPEDRNLVNVDLTIAFEESIIVRRDPEGPISWNGEKWAVCPLDIDVAEELENMDGKSNA